VVFPSVDDQIWQGWKNQIVWFGILDDPISVVLGQSKGRRKTSKLWSSRVFEAWKGKERHQGVKPCVDNQIWHSGKTEVSGFPNWNIQFLQLWDGEYF
jgi:hypothetical protein